MEDVPEVYHRPYDERRPLVCLDEASEQLIGETAVPIPAAPGRLERFDHEGRPGSFRASAASIWSWRRRR